MLLILDNYDSFTHNLVDYFMQLNVEHRLLKNDECSVQQIIEMKPKAIVLSPGPGRPAEAGICMDLIHAFHKDIPILGICLGHQAVGEYFGAQLVNASKPVHGKTVVLDLDSNPIWDGFEPKPKAMCYHSLILEKLDKTPLKVIANTESGEVMAIEHDFLPIFGFQFHPESILTEMGINYLSNWLITVDFGNISTN